MARGLNKVMLIGRLGKDPDVRYTQDGRAVANFTLATNEDWKDKATGEKKEKTEWHRVVAFGKLGEICGEYLCKGKQVYIEGKLQTRTWDKDGVTRYTTEVVASDMQMLDAKNASGGYAPADDTPPFEEDSGPSSSSAPPEISGSGGSGSDIPF